MTITNKKGPAMRLAAFAPLLLLAALGGCINLGLGTSKSPPAMMTLTPDSAPVDGSTMTGKSDSALGVVEPDTTAKLAVLRVPVTVDATHVAYLKGALWVERPTRLFQHLLAETMRARGKHLVVEGNGGTHSPLLSGHLIDFGYDAPTQAVVVRFDAVRQSPDGTTETRRFEASVAQIGPTAAAVSPALNQAANQVAKAVADWVN